MPDIELKIISSLEKCFPDETLNGKPNQTVCSVFRNQRLCLQAAYRTEELLNDVPFLLRPVVKGALAPYIRIRQVQYVPSLYAADLTNCDENYLRRCAGLYPDPLRPLLYNGCAILYPRQLDSLWLDAMLPEELPAGEYPLVLELHSERTGECLAGAEVTVQVCGLSLPRQKRIHTEWFYADCLAEQYHVPVFSEKHWRIIGSFLQTAVQNGINMILTPVFTPELDTAVGRERLTTQLVGITVEADGAYRFDFSALDRWIGLCRDAGVEYFEFPHLFSQWGAKHAPKIVAKVNGRRQTIFGWQTDALGATYARFLSCFLPALVSHLEEMQLAGKCYFHISDEPKLAQLEHYIKCRDLVVPHLKHYPVIDALSDYAFAKSGAVMLPVPSVQHIQPFLDAHVSPLWTYYSGAHGCSAYTGRYLSMPLARTRIIGVQMYMADVQGFLHWGYNFWHTKLSYDVIDPRLMTDCGCFNPSGDCFLVYPGEEGRAWESMRLNAMREAMEDIRMLELYESAFGKEATKRMLLEQSGGRLDFRVYPTEAAFFSRLRAHIMKKLLS